MSYVTQDEPRAYEIFSGTSAREVMSSNEETASNSDSDMSEDDEALMSIDMPESVYNEIVVTIARGRPAEIFSSSLLVVICIAVQLVLSIMMSGELADDAAGLFGMVNISGVPASVSNFNNNSLFGIWSRSPNKGMSCDFDKRRKWWACNQLSWSYEADAAEAMSSYFSMGAGGMYNGTLFGAIALFLWIGYQVMEIKSIMNYAQLLFLPSGAPPGPDGHSSRTSCCPKEGAPKGGHYSYNTKEKVGHIRSLNFGAKFAACGVLLARIVICGFLTKYGAQWLAYTDTLQDFILNSVALVFVYDIDGLFFTIFLSGKKQRRLTSLEPPLVHGFARTVHRLTSGTFAELVGIALTFLVTIWIMRKYLMPYGQTYYQAWMSMCSDTLDESFYSDCDDSTFNPVDLGPEPQFYAFSSNFNDYGSR